MNIFVTGATGVLGKAVVPKLIANGHVVRALSRSEENRVLLQGLGAHPVQTDLFDAAALQQVLMGCDAILQLASRIPPTTTLAKRSAWQENDHLRRDGTRTLVEAALAVERVQTFIYPSYAFVYPDSGERWVDASTTPAQATPILQSTLDAEAAVAHFSRNHRRGISLRIGSLYGPEAPTTYELLD
jgi:nucleoside-diphosphate-sugar epimerase